MKFTLNPLRCIPLLLAGCSGPLQEPADIVGLWVASAGAQMEFKSDGTFQARELTKVLFPLSELRTETVQEATGTWTLDAKERELTLKFAQLRGGNGGGIASMHVGGYGRTGELSFWIDEPWGKSLDFRRSE